MIGDLPEIIYFIISLVFSCFFSGSEAALVSISIDRTRQLIQEGGARGRALSFLAKRPGEILTTILIGNNVANIFAASLTTTIAQKHFGNDVLAMSVGVTTILILIFGEIVPKTYARRHSEALALPIVRVLQIHYYIMYPAVVFLSWIIHKILGKNAHLRGQVITKDDIEFMINKAEEEKTIDSKQLDFFNSVLEFPTIKVKDVMIPRSKVVYIGAELTYREVIDGLKGSSYSRYPVCKEEDLDQIIGFLHVKDLAFIPVDQKQKFNIHKILKSPFFVFEHMKIQAVFEHMNRKRVHLALVKDENGLVVGIVTLEDIVEEIFGEIQDEHDKEGEIGEFGTIKGTQLIVPGTITLRDLDNEYDIEIPLNDNYSTLTGFLLDMLGNNFPTQGNIIVRKGLSFELSKVVDYEIREVKITDVDGEKHIFSRSNFNKNTKGK